LKRTGSGKEEVRKGWRVNWGSRDKNSISEWEAEIGKTGRGVILSGDSEGGRSTHNKIR